MKLLELSVCLIKSAFAALFSALILQTEFIQFSELILDEKQAGKQPQIMQISSVRLQISN